MPENMQANDGRGSSWFYDNIAKCCCCCCVGEDSVCKTHFGNDNLAGGWLFFILTTLLVPFSFFTFSYGVAFGISSIVCAVGFSVGSGIFVYVSYPENMLSTVIFDTLTCTKRSGDAPASDRDSMMSTGEGQSLL